ncbi:MAG: heparinase II/III family protein, partial [Asticcacaulis sp.]
AMPELSLSPVLIKKGRSHLAAEAAKQILPDGVPAEQSPTYGAFTGEFMLLCAHCALAAGQPLDKVVDQRLELLAGFIGWISDAHGRTPQFCDDDNGRVLTLCEPEHTYATSVASAIAAHIGKPVLSPARAPHELRNAILGAGAEGRAPSGIKTFADGGYSVVRSAANGHSYCLTIDHAPLGYLSIAAHGHADALSFVLDIDDQPVFVDPGTYLYHSGGEWRNWFRGTRSHNTLSVNGADQSLISGSFNWSHKAHARLDEAVLSEQWLIRASHDGYEQRFKVRHERRFAASEGGFSITDRLTGGSGGEACEIVFQLDGACEAVMETPHQVVVSREGRAILRLGLDPAGTVSLSRGGPEMSGGWVSESFGEKHAATRVQWNGAARSEGIVTQCSII